VIVGGREVSVRKFFLVLFLADATICAVITPWMGVIMWQLAEELVAAGRISPSPLDWICPIVLGCYGPVALVMAADMTQRYWNKPATT
jgi:hypothetical protein